MSLVLWTYKFSAIVFAIYFIIWAVGTMLITIFTRYHASLATKHKWRLEAEAKYAKEIGTIVRGEEQNG